MVKLPMPKVETVNDEIVEKFDGKSEASCDNGNSLVLTAAGATLADKF